MAFITIINALRQHLFFNVCYWALNCTSAHHYTQSRQIKWGSRGSTVIYLLDYERLVFEQINLAFAADDARGGWKMNAIDWECYLGEV